MRALFTCHPTFSHFLPLTPIAHAMAAAGHDVAFGAPSTLRPAVEVAGFRWVRAGVENDDPELAAVRAAILELRGFDLDRFIHEHSFGTIRPRRMVPDLLALAESWRPDLFVHDSRECGALIAAELLDSPRVKVEVLATGVAPRHTPMLYVPLQRVRTTFGLPARPIQAWMDEYLVLAPFPASLNLLDAPIAPTTHHFRGLPADDTAGGLPAWIDAIDSRPLVYVSMGTSLSGDRRREIFSELLEGLGDIEAEIIVTIGTDLDPATLEPTPANVHLERFLPLGALLPRCSLVVFHGGSGTLGHVIAHGLPMVILPFVADQPENAQRCAELGASATLDQDNLTPEHVREVVLDVLHTPSYRQAAERLRDEFSALPGPEFVVELLERLARDKMPIVASR